MHNKNIALIIMGFFLYAAIYFSKILIIYFFFNVRFVLIIHFGRKCEGVIAG